jgi:hypothetical protein
VTAKWWNIDTPALQRFATLARADLVAENERLKENLETERLRLAACSVAALGYFDECKDEYKSASLSDVLALRTELEAAKADAAWLRELIKAHIKSSNNDDSAGDTWGDLVAAMEIPK